MKTVIVYYSLEGNTAYAAEKAAELLGAELLRLFPKKAYPDSGFRKFLWGGKSALMAEKPPLEPYVFDAAAWDRVILAFPVWASNVAPPIRTFLAENDLRGKRIAAIACQAGSGAEKAFRRLLDCTGAERLEAELILIDPKQRPSAENERKLREFCAGLECAVSLNFLFDLRENRKLFFP